MIAVRAPAGRVRHMVGAVAEYGSQPYEAETPETNTPC
jgi:hypothetical protein